MVCKKVMSFFKKIKLWLLKPFRFEKLDSFLKNRGSLILDVGCGNQSPTKTKEYYPSCEYHGLDCIPDYNNKDGDLKNCDRFWLVNLENSDEMNKIPNGTYDVVIFSHVIEHLYQGDAVVRYLVQKLKKGGVIYIETPSQKSLKLPSMKGTLNFYDDKTHVKCWSPQELNAAVTEAGCEIFESKVRRHWKRILLTPMYLLGGVILGKSLATSLWDILGAAYYVVAVKK